MAVFQSSGMAETMRESDFFAGLLEIVIAQPLIQSVLEDLLGRGVCPSTGETARRTSQVMDTVLAGYYGGRQDAFWARPAKWPGRRK